MIPTVETALFLLSGDDLKERLFHRHLFKTDHFFYKQSIVEIQPTRKEDPEFSGILRLSQTFLDLFVDNQLTKPRFSEDFPAHLLSTTLEWKDLLLGASTRNKLEEVNAYLKHYQTLVEDWEMSRHSKKGHRVLFYGESGTGKTLAAKLLGKHLKKDVYRVDISTVTSKYVGESSKRLNSLFNIAESKGWIIFFDEGDALLGQRKSGSDTGKNTHYANQDVSFLLQRIESYDGIIIVATNLRGNLDLAFTRRFESMVHFKLPNEDLQYQFWMDNLPEKIVLESGIDLRSLIRKYPLSPASIINVIYRVCILALKDNETTITYKTLETSIMDETFKYKGRQSIGL